MKLRPREKCLFVCVCALSVLMLMPYSATLIARETIAPVELDGRTLRRDVPKVDDSPLGFLRSHGLVDIPAPEVLLLLDNITLFQIYHSYLDNTDYICRRKLRMGNISDGGWEVCDDVDIRPEVPCVVYSFGINFDFSFDDDIANLYQCEVFSFDPSMGVPSYRRSRLVRFYNIGIAGVDYVTNRGWDLRTLSSIMETLHHTDVTLDVLKMDIERFEWQSLVQIIESGVINQVRQLLIEFHGGFETKETAYPALSILREIHQAGFRKFYVHKNPACKRYFNHFPISRTKCYEIHYVNVNMYRPKYSD